ncbi:MAG: hypothetical protein LBI91_00065 [Spirochaetaceae bacterium]|jgi:hypothetical protein|nr:hypothetical protein [Spirochaetaceae bacterium]
MKTAAQMKAKPRDKAVFRLAVLVPHRDIRPALYSYRRRLFAAGILGAYTFPPAVPLALLEKPLDDYGLKCLALTLRALSLEAGGGFFTTDAEELSLISCPGGLSFWGLPLNIPAPPGIPGALPFLPTALCAAACGTDPEAEREILLKTDGPPLLRFRAAAAANLSIKFFPGGGVPDNAFPGLSSRWRIGKPFWLKKI